jgi:hypothetical protein
MLVQRRLDLTEILPLWLRLGQWVPHSISDQIPWTGTASLLTKCQEAIASKHPERISTPLLNLFRAGFRGILSPRLVDDQHQGIPVVPLDTKSKLSPLVLLKSGAALIRSLFIQQRDHTIQILPALPPEFHCGRFVDVRCDGGMLNLEWSKKTIRRMVFRADRSGTVTFGFQSELKQFRLRRSMRDRGMVILCGSSFPVVEGESYLLDRFER